MMQPRDIIPEKKHTFIHNKLLMNLYLLGKKLQGILDENQPLNDEFDKIYKLFLKGLKILSEQITNDYFLKSIANNEKEITTLSIELDILMSDIGIVGPVLNKLPDNRSTEIKELSSLLLNLYETCLTKIKFKNYQGRDLKHHILQLDFILGYEYFKENRLNEAEILINKSLDLWHSVNSYSGFSYSAAIIYENFKPVDFVYYQITCDEGQVQREYRRTLRLVKGAAKLVLGQIKLAWGLIDEAAQICLSAKADFLMVGIFDCNFLLLCKKIAVEYMRQEDWFNAAQFFRMGMHSIKEFNTSDNDKEADALANILKILKPKHFKNVKDVISKLINEQSHIKFDSDNDRILIETNLTSHSIPKISELSVLHKKGVLSISNLINLPANKIAKFVCEIYRLENQTRSTQIKEKPPIVVLSNREDALCNVTTMPPLVPASKEEKVEVFQFPFFKEKDAFFANELSEDNLEKLSLPKAENKVTHLKEEIDTNSIKQIRKNENFSLYFQAEVVYQQMVAEGLHGLYDSFLKIANKPKFCSSFGSSGIKGPLKNPIKGKVVKDGEEVEIEFNWQMKVKGVGGGKDARVLAYEIPLQNGKRLIVASLFIKKGLHDAKQSEKIYIAPELTFEPNKLQNSPK